MAKAASRYDQARFENPQDTAKRHASGYVTERERRFLALIRERQATGIAVTPAQIDYAANIEGALRS